jgi:hypothetical protein
MYEIIVSDKVKNWMGLHLKRNFNEEEWHIEKIMKEEKAYKLYNRLPTEKIYPKILIVQLLRGNIDFYKNQGLIYWDKRLLFNLILPQKTQNINKKQNQR